MISKQADRRSGQVRVVFTLPRNQPPEPVWVVGEFNDWSEGSHPLLARSNGLRSAVVRLPAGQRYAFRYRTASGAWFDEADADERTPNPHGSTNGIVVT